MRVVSLQDRLRSRLMLMPREAVEKQDCGCLDTEPLQHASQRINLRIVERRFDLAVGEHALFDLEAQRPLHQRLVFAEEQIVRIRPVDAADLVDVAESLRHQERGLGARALQDGVDGDRGAMQKQPGGFVRATRFNHAGIDPLDQPVRRR